MTLYLKYRPKDFESLEWQTFIKETLRQAVAQEKLVGAYLFCGPRWTGKTSSARIFAKAINCLHPANGNPCGTCDICKNFDEEKLVDIIEIDAASYTWVDNVREIIERASFVPNVCKYKVYIIDEVHMLSKWAFNALLKILEEPPSHLKFILATTEIHKIPETILSRCQRYDFKSISSQDVESRLRFIAEKEWVTIDQNSIDFIVKQANWWLRNAISLFEQLIVNKEIVFDRVIENFWIPQTELIQKIYDKIFQWDTSVVQDFEEMYQKYNPQLFYKELLFFIKDQMLENIWHQNLGKIIFILETLEEAFHKSKTSFDPKTSYLIGIIKAVSWKNLVIPTATLWEKKEISTPVSQIKNIPPQKVEIPQTQTISQLEDIELSPTDLLDVFGDDDGFVAPVEEKPQSVQTASSSNFEKENFISILKTLWAKWAITMSLRSSEISLINGNQLCISAKTTIAKNQLWHSDSISLMTQACQQMALNEVEIKIL